MRAIGSAVPAFILSRLEAEVIARPRNHAQRLRVVLPVLSFFPLADDKRTVFQEPQPTRS